MAETKLIRLIPTRGRIPHELKTYKTINVSHPGVDLVSHKVIQVALPKNLIIEKSSQDNIPDSASAKSDEDIDGSSLSKNALLARKNRLKKKRYVNGLEESLSKAKKENENLLSLIKEKDLAIENLKKEITYFQSILANVQEIASLIRTVRKESPMPLTTSLTTTAKPLKRLLVDSDTVPCKKVKLDSLSESSEEAISVSEEDCDDFSSWITQSPVDSSTIDLESIDVLSSFHEEDLGLVGEDMLLSGSGVKFSSPSDTAIIPGICLHIRNKKISLEFCSSCASKAEDH